MELSKTKASKLAALKMKKHRDRENVFCAEGDRCVGELLPWFKVRDLVAVPEWISRHPEHEHLVSETDRKTLDKISSLSTAPEVFAVFERPLVECPDILPDDLYIALDGVQDPGNLGTIIRIADWFGIKYVFLSRGSVDVFGPKAVQSTMGALARVKVAYTDLTDLFRRHPEFPVYGMCMNGSDLYEAKLEMRGFIVMGNEGNGLSEEVSKLVDRPLTIPPFPPSAGHVESLNVSIATAITVSEFRRRQLKG